MGEYLEGRPGLISDKQGCVKRPRICWPVAEEAGSISGFQPLLWAAGAAGDSGAPRPALDSRASWEIGEGLASPTSEHPPASRSSQARWMPGSRKPSLDVKTSKAPGSDPPPPSPLPFHGCYLLGGVAFGALSSSRLTIGRGRVGPRCFPMGRVSCLCGLGLVAGRLWFLVEGLDQGCAKARQLFRAPVPATAEGLPGPGRSQGPCTPPTLLPNIACFFPDLGLRA